MSEVAFRALLAAVGGAISIASAWAMWGGWAGAMASGLFLLFLVLEDKRE